jgi:hypothetical protein
MCDTPLVIIVGLVSVEHHDGAVEERARDE